MTLLQLTLVKSNLQGKLKKGSSYRGENYKENDLKGKIICFELTGGSSSGVNCVSIDHSILLLKGQMTLGQLQGNLHEQLAALLNLELSIDF